MRILGWLLIAIIVVAGGLYSLKKNPPVPATPMPQETQNAVKVTPIMHATMLLEWSGTNIYTDPTDATLILGKPAPDIILVTDIHSDHFSTTTLAAIMGSTTVLVVPQAVKDLLTPELAARATLVKNGETISAGGFSITGVAMYNLPESPTAAHTKGRGNGYVVEKDGERIYIAGDTSATPEMRALTDIDIAFIPMNPPYTMSVEEAADGVLAFKPKTVYPYHYRGPDGLSDINKFKELVNAGNPSIEVILANWYPGM